MNLVRKKMIQPRTIRLEASTACQLKCPSCPTATGETGKRLGIGFLKFRDFKNIIDKNPWVSNIELSNWGEIFLNKELIKIIKYAYRHNVTLNANNGVNLNNVDDSVLEALVKYKFRKITCSIDGASQETYSIYRVKGNLQKVIENIKTINKFKVQYDSSYPRLRWQFIPFGHNEHEIRKAREMAKDLNMEFYIKLSWEDLYTESFSPIRNKELIGKETGLGVATRTEFRDKYGKEYILKQCCLDLWISPQINYDGRLLGCAVNHWDDYGNVLKEGLKECLNNEKINYAREMLMGKREGKEGIPCTQCKFYKRMKESKDWVRDGDIKEDYTKSRVFIMLENKILGYRLTKQLAILLVIVRRQLKSSPKLNSRVYSLRIPLKSDEEKGWKPYPIFNGSTKGLRWLSCHASVLTYGQCPHSPHRHREEELLLLLGGEVDLILPDDEQVFNENHRRRLKPGQFVYYPSYFAHTLQTMSEEPANYLMFKWYSDSKKNDSALGFGHFNMLDSVKGSGIKDGFYPRLVFEGSTTYLQKLQCHTTTLTPQAGYEPHIDPYDVAIIILEGEVKTLGKHARPNDVIFYAAGEPHGMRNPGEDLAKYIVFEFHGHDSFFAKLTDIKYYKRKLKHLLGFLR